MVTFAILFAAVPAAILLIVALVTRRRARQPVGLVIPEYAPVPQSAVLYDAVMADADARALPAALVDLAIRGKVRLLTSERGAPGAPARRRLRARSGAALRGSLSVELVEGAQFTDQERRVLAVFLGERADDRSVRRLSTDRGETGRRAAALLRDTVGELAAAGLIVARSIRWPHHVCRVVGVAGILACAGIAGLCWTMLGEDRTAGGGIAVAAVSAAAAVAAMILCPGPWRRFLPPSLSIRRHLAGLREYIRLAEADRLRVLQSPEGAVRVPVGTELDRIHVHERLLPYAILFGLEREWAEVLRTEAARLDVDALDGVASAGEVVVAALQLADIAVTIVHAAASAGELVDAGGAVLEGVGDLLSL